MFIDIDLDKRPKDYKIELAKPNKTIVANLSERFDSSLNLKLGNIHELNFSIPFEVEENLEMVKNKNISKVKELMYLKLTWGEYKEWFLIDNITEVSDSVETMKVQAFSNSFELKRKKIEEYKETSVTARELFEYALQGTAWKIGVIDNSFSSLYRSFDISSTNRFDLINSGAETFGGVLVWDSENKTVSLKELDNIGSYKGFSVDYDRLMSGLNKTRKTEDIVTRLYVYGNEGITIENVNPANTRYIENFSYFMYPFERDTNKNVVKSSDYMSDELCHALLDNMQLKTQYEPQIKSLQVQIETKNAQLSSAMINLDDLKFSLSSAKGLLDIAKAVNDKPLIEQRKSEVANMEAQVASQQNSVKDIETAIKSLHNQIVLIQNAISTKNFTQALLDELDPFIIEKEIRDDRYISEVELYDFAVSEFARLSSPQTVIETSLNGFLNAIEEQYYWDKVVLGDKMRVKQTRMSVDYKSTIVEINVNLDTTDVDIKIASFTKDLDEMDKFISLLYSSSSNSTLITNNKYKWDSVLDVRDEVTQLRESEIDATVQRITAGVNESVEIGDRGIIITTPSFPNEMIIMQAGVIALSEDNGETWNTSMTPRGVIADTIIGKLIASNNLIVTNSSGSFVMDSEGLEIDADSIKIMSGGDNPQNIIDDWNNVIIDMGDFSNDGKLVPYEKLQIRNQWNNIADSHDKIIQSFVNNMGAETTENPYPVEYDQYLFAFENLRRILFTTNQSDGYPILATTRMNETSPVDSVSYNGIVRNYLTAKDKFILIIPVEYSKAYLEVLETGISMNYVKNGEVVAKVNASEDGVRIDGRLLEINARTEFNDDLVMNAGLIQDANGDITIDLNKGEINLRKPLTINYIPIATQQDLENASTSYTAMLSSEVSVVSTDSNGANGNFANATTSIHVYYKDADVSGDGWVVTAIPSSGINGTLDGNDYIVTSMTVDSGYVDLTITKNLISFTKRFSISKSRAGTSGSSGTSAKTLRLSTDKEVMSFNSDDTANPTSQVANFEVFLQNLTGSPIFTATAYNGTTSLGTVNDKLTGTGLKRTLSVSGFLTNATHVSVTATLSGLSDTVSIVKIKNGREGADGENAIIGYLTNEAVVLPAHADGVVSNYETASGFFKVYDGLSDVSNGATYAEVSLRGITININPTTGQYVVESMSDVIDDGYAEIQATYRGVKVIKRISVTKSKQGHAGSDAKLLFLTSSAEAMTFNSDNTPTVAQTITIDAKLQNTTGNATWTAIPYNSNTALTAITLGGTGNVKTLTSAQVPATATRIVVTATLGSLTDTVTIVKLKNGSSGIDGQDAVIGYLTNESATLGASSAGVVSSYAGANGIFKVFKGLTNVTASATFSVYDSTGITATINTSGAYTVSNMTTDTATVEFKALYSGLEITKTLTIAKSKAGTNGLTPVKGVDYFDGVKGQDGVSSYVWIRYSQNSNGNPMTTTPLGAKYIGFATTTASSAPTGYASYTWTLIKGTDGIPGESGPDGKTSYLHIKYSDNGTTFTANNGETEGKWIGIYVDFVEADSTVFSAYTWNKVVGEDGADAKLLYLSATAEAITFDANGTTPNPTTQTITFTANTQNTTGNATFVATPYNGSTALTAITLGGTGNIRTLTQAQFPATANRIQITATMGNLVDTVSVVKLKNGSIGENGQDALVGYLTNEAITLPASTGGGVSAVDLAKAKGTFKIYDGLLDKTGSGVTYSVSESSGAVANITSAGLYTVTAISADSATITFKAVYKGLSIEKVLTLSKSRAGEKGESGANATSYWLNLSDSIIVKDTKGNMTPPTITFTSFSKIGEGLPTAYVGRFIIQVSTDGTSYQSAYTSSANQSAHEFTIPSDAKSIRVRLYQAGGTTSLLDEQSIPVLVDIDSGVIDGVSLQDKTEILSGVGEVFTDKADDDAVVHVEIDGKSVGGGSGKNLNTPFWSKYEIQTVTMTGWDIYFDKYENVKAGESYTAKIWLEPTVYPVRTMLEFGTTGSASYNKQITGNTIEVGNSGYSEVTTIASTDGWVRQSIRHTINQTGNNPVYYKEAQMEKGSTATTYELPAPTPDYPIAINSLNNFDVVSSVGRRNLLPKTSKAFTKVIVNQFGWTSPTYTLKELGLKNGEDVVLTSAILTNNNNERVALRIDWMSEGGTYISSGLSETVIKNREDGVSLISQVPSSNEFTSFRWRVYPVESYWGYEAYYGQERLEKGTQANNWAPAPEDISYDTFTNQLYKTNILLSEPLRSLGDIKDRVYRNSNGLWEVERNVGEYTFKGTEQWIVEQRFVNDEMIQMYAMHIPNQDSKAYVVKGISNRFIDIGLDAQRDNNRNEGIWVHNGYSVVRFKFDPNKISQTMSSTNGEIITSMNNWLKNNQTIILYKLNTSTIETLPQVDQDKLNNIATYAGSNYVYTLVDKTDILSEQVRKNLQPTIHATFKSKGWYYRFRTTAELNSSIKSAETQYYLSTSETALLNGSWSNIAPVWDSGKFMWSRTLMTKIDGTTYFTPSANGTNISGAKGDSAVVGYLTNESINIATDVNGTVTASDLTKATGTFRVFDGLVEKTTTAQATFFKVSESGASATINSNGIYTVTTLAHDNATITFRAVYNGVSIDKVLNLSKARAGSKGADGVSPIVGYLTNESITLPASNAGVVSSFSGANGTFNVYEGSTLRNTQTTYSIISQSNITVTLTQLGVYTVTAMTSGATILSGNATLRAVYGGVTVDRILTITKAVAGATGGTGATGGSGAKGTDATSYWINASVNAIKKDVAGKVVPSTITFSGFSKTGTANPVAYAGRFIIQTSTDGSAYTTRYTSSANQSSYAYTIPNDVSFVKAKYYLAGGVTVLLDEQTIPVLVDAEGLSLGGVNRIIQSRITRGRYLTVSGSESPDPQWFYTDFIPVSSYSNMVTSGYTNLGTGPAVVYYDSTKAFVKGIANAGQSLAKNIVIDNGIAFIRFSGMIRDLPTLQLESGNVPTDYSSAPEDVEDAYKAVAKAQADLAQANAIANADGKISAEEKRAIADAQDKLDKAKKYVDDLEIGGRNLIVNSTSEWTPASIGQWGAVDIAFIPVDGVNLKHGDEVTLSVYVSDIPKGEAVYPRLDWWSGTTYTSITDSSFVITGEGRLIITGRIPNDGLINRVGFRIMPVAWTRNYTVSYMREQLEKGNKATDWTEAPEDTDAKIGGKADQENLDAVIGDVDAVKEGLDTKLDNNTYYAQNAEYQEWLTRVENTANTADDISKMLQDDLTAVNINMNGQAQRWTSFDSFIQFNGEDPADPDSLPTSIGIAKGVKMNAETGKIEISTGMLLDDESLTFYSGGEAVAQITSQYLKIEKGIFTNSAQVGRHKFEPLSSDNDHFILSYVGGS